MSALHRLRALALLLAPLLMAACGEPPRTPRVASEPGVLLVATDPGGADLQVNGQHYGRTPADSGEALAVKLPPGRHTVEAIKPDGEHAEWVARHEQEVGDTPLAQLTLRLERRLTPAGEQARAEFAQRLEAREQALITAFDIQDSVVTDTRTGLMWMRCSVGQTWAGETCAGEPRKLSWHQAGQAGDGFAWGEHSDWRLPTREELHGITYCSTGRRFGMDKEGAGGACEGNYRRPTILEPVFPNTPVGNFWSSTEHPVYSHSAFGVAFANGVVGAGSKTEYVHVRLVRQAH